MDYRTLATLIVTAAIAPWLSKLGVTLSPGFQDTLAGLIVVAPTAIVHWFETRAKHQQVAANVTRAVEDAYTAGAAAKPIPAAMPAAPTLAALSVPAPK